MAQESLTVVRERLLEYLTGLDGKIRAEGKAGFYSAHKMAEPVIRNLMNTLYGLELKLEGEVNAAGFDLCGRQNGVVVQVSGNCTGEKVKECLRATGKRVADSADLENPRLYIVFLTIDKHAIEKLRKNTGVKFQKGELSAEGFQFAPDADILFLDHFNQILRDDRCPNGSPLRPEQVQQIQALLDKHAPGSRAPEPELKLPIPTTLGASGFVGRETELAQIAADLKGGAKPVILSGLGGMGKTELAARFCGDYAEGNVYFVRFRENFTQTVAVGVASGLEGYDQRKSDADRDYGDAMARLKRCGKGDILVIDNADEESGDFGRLKKDPAYGDLLKLDLRLIITTRCQASRAIPVGHMENPVLYKIFENHGLSLNPGQMDALIGAVNGHTMTVDLMARTLKRNRRLSVEKLLEALRDGTLADQNYRSVGTDRNGEGEQVQIYGHLRNLFNVAEVSEAGRELLRNMALLPEDGMALEILESVLDEDGLELLDDQIDHGWLTFDEDTRFVSIHPVIRLVCREELKPNDDSCEAFLDAVLDQYDPNQYDAVTFRQFAELFSQAADLLPDGQGTWALLAGRLWCLLGQPGNAIRYERRIMELCKEAMEEPEILALVYNNLGNTCIALGDYGKALEYALEALKIWEKEYPPDHPDLALPYNNLSQTYSVLGDYDKGLAYMLKALQIQESTRPENQYNLGKFHNNLGHIYTLRADYQKALDHTLKAIEIWEKELPEDHPDLGTSYSNAGLIYCSLGDYPKSLEYTRFSQQIWEKALPADHPDLAKAYNNLGQTYCNMGKYDESLTYAMKAVEIWEKVLPAEHPDLALCYSNIGQTYYSQGNYTQARKYSEQARKILEAVFPSGHPNLAMLYNNLGNIRVRQGEKEAGLELLQKALGIWRNTLPSDHPNLGLGYMNVGYAYEAMGDHTQELRYKLAAVHVYEKALPGDHATLAMVYKNLGVTYASMNKHGPARMYKRKALNIYEKLLSEEDLELAEMYNSLGFSCYKTGDLWWGRSYFLKAVEIAGRSLPEGDKDLERYRHNAAAVHRMIEARRQATQQKITE